MLRILFFVIMALATGFAHATDFWTEVQTTKASGISFNQINAGLSANLSGLVGYYAFGQSTNNGYQQIYAGPKVNPTNWLEFGVAVGAEKTASSDWMKRTAVYAWVGKAKISLLGVYENGGTGPWHKLVLNYKVTPELTLGIQSQSYLGTGPRVEYSLGKNVSLWGTALKGENGPTNMVAIKIKF